MTYLRAWVLAVTAVILGLIGYLVASYAEHHGLATPVLHWISLIAVLALAVGLLAAAIWVYRTRTRQADRHINPLAAVRVALLGQASAYVGAGIFLGWHAGVAVQLWAGHAFGSPVSWTTVFQAVGGIVLIVVGYIVQTLCKLPPDAMDTTEPEDAPRRGLEEGPESV
ncbi:MAG: DUF3180 domain-containing protein [Galactobacter sp.]|uniref:DUF3180 domain-containing protein n=1 Tax=Galactobacter sp. TaxID=2676125 RepID=UPI0025BA5BB3|nr:DUF3180 domain-containing protein [Galactobacter sp.]